MKEPHSLITLQAMDLPSTVFMKLSKKCSNTNNVSEIVFLFGRILGLNDVFCDFTQLDIVF